MTPLTRQQLDRSMRVVLAQLELCSNGTTTTYNHAGGGGGDNPNPRPPGGTSVPHLHWARMYGYPFIAPTPDRRGAANDGERAQIIQDANDDLQAITGRGSAVIVKPAGETVEQRNQRIVDEGDGYTVKEAAIKFRCGERDVRKARIDGGVEPSLGKRPESAESPTERRRRVTELREERGYSVASIAMLLKVSKATVKRDLRMADAA